MNALAAAVAAVALAGCVLRWEMRRARFWRLLVALTGRIGRFWRKMQDKAVVRLIVTEFEARRV